MVAQLHGSAQAPPCPARSLRAAPATPSGGGAPYAAGHRAPTRGMDSWRKPSRSAVVTSTDKADRVIVPVAFAVVSPALDAAIPNDAVA